MRYRELPDAAARPRRQRADGLLAHALLGLMVLVSLLFWGPIPIVGLWIASQVQFLTDSIVLGLLAGFVDAAGHAASAASSCSSASTRPGSSCGAPRASTSARA